MSGMSGMKRFCKGFLTIAAIGGLLLSGCAVSSPEEAATAGSKTPESTLQETEPQDTKNPGAAAQEPETTEPAISDSAAQEPEDEGRLAEIQPENCVHAQWAEEVLTDLPDYEQFIQGMGEELPLVCFSTEQTVADFKVLSLTFEAVDDDGNIRFAVEETYNHGTMTPEEPLLVRMELMGTIPNNGISYVDENGATRYFAIDVSGYDGSLLLTEFTL